MQKAVTGTVKDAVEAAVDEALDALDEKPADEGPILYYGSVDEFVREYLLKNYRRRVDDRRTVWAADWWNYPEATFRLEALWRA